MTFAEVVEASVAAVSPALAPAPEELPPRQQRPRRRGIEATGGANGHSGAHADGVANIANRARAAGATEAEIQEAVEVAYLFGGTPALVTAVNAFRNA